MEFAYPLDGTQNYTADKAGAFNGTRTSGVWSGEDNLKASVTGARQISISGGLAWFTTDKYWGKVYCNTDIVNFTVPTADAVLDQIVRFVVRWNKTLNQAKLMMLEGEKNSNPVAPARSQTDELFDLVIADYKVMHGETEISAARLTDQRLNEELCGLMRDGVTRIPTETLQKQAEGVISDTQEQADILIKAIEDQLAQATGGTAYELKRLQFENVTVQPSDFVSDDTSKNFPYRAAIPLDGVLSTMTPQVTFGEDEAISGNFSPVSDPYTGGVYIYAGSVPDAAITIPTIELRKAVE